MIYNKKTMTITEINKTYNRIIGSLDSLEMKNAFDHIQGLMAGCRDYSAQDRLDELQNTYRYLLRYRMEGAKDPMQEQIYRDLRASAYELADVVRNRALAAESPLAYYGRRRILRNDTSSFSALHASLGNWVAATREVKGSLEAQQNLERDLMTLFYKVWVADALTAEQIAGIGAILSDGTLPVYVRCEVVSALTMALQAFFDKEKLALLFDAAEIVEPAIRARALVGILLTLYIYDKRVALYPRIGNRLAALAERFPGLTQAIRSVTIRFILARETEKITRQMQDDILPEMMRIGSKIGQKINLREITPEQLLDEEMNPEWKELAKNSDLEKKMQEFTELQMEGADIMHSTFVHLKNYPFFREISNWFLPFTLDHSALAGLSFGSGDNSLIGSLAESAMFCDSDKYSLYFSMAQLPPSARQMMLGQMDGQALELLRQERNRQKGERESLDAEVRQYVQDLYRFYKLHPSHLDFKDIFALPLDFHNLPVLRPYINDRESLTAIAEFYLRKKYYAEALKIYQSLAEGDPEDGMLSQKIGFCEQMSGNIEQALEAYLKADLIHSDSKWVIRRIATCYRTLKQPGKALEYYHRYEALAPDDLSIQISIGHCHLDLRHYSEALRYFFKVDYLSGGNPKTWRPIAWCSFLNGRYDQARDYYRKIIGEGANAQDYLNAGHTEWATGNMRGAIDLYREAVAKENGDFGRFLELFNADIADLNAAGIEDEEIPLLLDALRYAI